MKILMSTVRRADMHVKIMPCGRRAKLLKNFSVVLEEGIIVVPMGFETDFASVPRFFWCIIPPWGKYSPAALVHDYLYVHQSVSRKKADQIFLELMEILGVPKFKRKLMYAAVRVGGRRHYNKHSEGNQDIELFI